MGCFVKGSWAIFPRTFAHDQRNETTLTAWSLISPGQKKSHWFSDCNETWPLEFIPPIPAFAHQLLTRFSETFLGIKFLFLRILRRCFALLKKKKKACFKSGLFAKNVFYNVLKLTWWMCTIHIGTYYRYD